MRKKGIVTKQAQGAKPKAESDDERKPPPKTLSSTQAKLAESFEQNNSGIAAIPSALSSCQESDDMEPISYDAAMSLPSYPDFALSPLSAPSHSVGGEGEAFQGQDLSFFFQMMQSVRSSEETEKDDSPQTDANRRI